MTAHAPDIDTLVIGAGSWGTALAMLISRNGYPTLLWGNEPEQLLKLEQDRENKQYLPANCPFPKQLHICHTLESALKQAEHILIAVPSHAFRSVLKQIQPALRPDAKLCWASKGFEQKTHLQLHQVAEQVLGKQIALSVVSGPTFAGEVAKGLHTAMTVASRQQAQAEIFASRLRNTSSRIYTHTDLIGVQVGGSAKNVIAIAAGIADGLGFGANTRAALITRGLHEIMQLGVALGGKQETFMGLTGLGDLVLTCTDNQSRNRRFGFALGQGKDKEQTLKQIGQVVEGISAAEQISAIAKKYQIEMPITRAVNNVLSGKCTPEQAVQALSAREPKAEFNTHTTTQNH